MKGTLMQTQEATPYDLISGLSVWYHPTAADRLLPEPQRTKELTEILGVCVKKGWLDDARKAAELLGRSLTPEELTGILGACVKEGRLGDARETAELLPEPRRTKELTWILGADVKGGWLDEARRTADAILGE